MKALTKLLLLGLVIFGLSLPCYAEKIVIEGSTTVLPIAQKAAEVFMAKNPQADISVRGGGSSVGIASMIDGTCDIADASRPIKQVEIEKALANGRDPKAHIVAMDGIAVVVNPANKVSALTKKQVRDIYTGRISDWSEIGGNPGKIVVISRDSSSGTFEAFGVLVLEGQKVRPDALMQASNQALASIVARTPQAIAYIGLGFLSADVKPVTIDGIEPSKETVLSGKYPVTRPLFMYTNGAPERMVKEFMDFLKSPEGQTLAEEEGFVVLK